MFEKKPIIESRLVTTTQPMPGPLWNFETTFTNALEITFDLKRSIFQLKNVVS